VWLILLRVRYIVDLYYMVWQLCGWYCCGFVILLTFIIWFGSCVVDIAEGSLYCWLLLFGLAVVWLILLRVRYIVDFYYLVWQWCGWYCWGFVILLTFTIWFGSGVVDIAEGSLYCRKSQQYNEPSAISTTQLPNQIVKVNNITNPQQYQPHNCQTK
jgi:hypothetical protein